MPGSSTGSHVPSASYVIAVNSPRIIQSLFEPSIVRPNHWYSHADRSGGVVLNSVLLSAVVVPSSSWKEM